MFIKVTNSRGSQAEWVFDDCDFENNYDDQYFTGTLTFWADKECGNGDPEISDEIMAIVRFSVFEGPVYDKGDMEKKVIIADDHSGDEYVALSGLCRTLHRSSFGLCSDMSCTVYLETLSVEEDFRRNGLATWILSNLPELLWYYFRVEPQYVVTIPSPEGYSNIEECAPDKQVEIRKMHALMISVLKKNGFRKVKNQNVYYKKTLTF